jgi:outer membrane receptor protein involved in Fe transport
MPYTYRHLFLPALWAATTLGHAQGVPTLPEVRVIGTTPLPEGGLSLRQIPAAARTLDADPNGSPEARTIADLLDQRLGSVQVQSIQGNPFQPDVSFRGFSASPVLGTPQGLSIYLDGVRMNQPFGDVVSWDLVPRIAIDSITLMPGSNPLFGLNALGGSLSLRTKDGRSWPGTVLQLSGGSYGRRSLELEHGFARPDGLDGYFAVDLSHDHGWRQQSPSDLRQLFGKAGWQDARTRLTGSLSYADNELWGNGLQEQQLLQRDWSSVYTLPDITKNRSTLLTLTARHEPDAATTWSGNLYFRRIGTATSNGDVNDASLEESVYQPNAAERAALTAAGYRGFPSAGENAANTPFPSWRCLANVLLNDEPGEKCNGLINSGSTRQTQWGGSALLTRRIELAGRPNQFSAGFALDGSRIGYRQSTQLGYLNPDRSVTGLPAFADGVTGGEVDGEPFDNRVDLQGRTHTASIFAANTLSAGAWNWSAAARYNHTRVTNTDLITPAGDPSSLSGRHTFARLNPALGVTYAPGAGWTAFVGYNEGTRTPSTIELACANPERPCRLPNAMAGDPPLRQVVTRTLEAGLRGRVAPSMGWSATVFRANSDDDIQFIAAPQTGFGYFQNVGRTRRQGLELGLDAKVDRVTLDASLTFLQATYRSAQTFPGGANSSNSAAVAGTPGLDGTINVQPGDRLPLVAPRVFKLNAQWEASSRWTLGATVRAQAGAFARGNENNRHQPDGVTFLGPGRTGGFALLDLSARYSPSKRLQWFARVDNVFDRRVRNAALLGEDAFDAQGRFVARPLPAVGGEFPVRGSTFFGPGAPRTLLVGLRYAIE